MKVLQIGSYYNKYKFCALLLLCPDYVPARVLQEVLGRRPRLQRPRGLHGRPSLPPTPSVHAFTCTDTRKCILLGADLDLFGRPQYIAQRGGACVHSAVRAFVRDANKRVGLWCILTQAIAGTFSHVLALLDILSSERETHGTVRSHSSGEDNILQTADSYNSKSRFLGWCCHADRRIHLFTLWFRVLTISGVDKAVN